MTENCVQSVGFHTVHDVTLEIQTIMNTQLHLATDNKWLVQYKDLQ